MTTKLTIKALEKYQKTMLLGWKVNKSVTHLEKEFMFKNFIEAFMFVTRVGVHAEVMQHYPKFELAFGTVTITLQTKDCKGITTADIDLAKYHINLGRQDQEIKDMRSRIKEELFEVLTAEERKNFDLDAALKRINNVFKNKA